MNTKAGKIQGNLHTWGFDEVRNFKVTWGNYHTVDIDKIEPLSGTDAYKAYMKQQISCIPNSIRLASKKCPRQP
ncbi:MAG: hypothetical protein OEM02_04525 [Desulfobulbaceae bacterium]|nr:hypothetical protein [Desulfobulbaceae bacterium]